MNSSYRNIHPVDNILTGLVAQAIPPESQLIAHQVFENIKIPERSGTLLLEVARAFMGSPDLDPRRAPGASGQEVNDQDRSEMTYKAEIYRLQATIAMEDIVDSQYPGSEEQRAAMRVRRALLLAKEKRAADLLFNTSVFTNTNNCTALMGGKVDAAGTNALSGLDILKEQVYANAHGIDPDTMIIGRGTARALARSPEFRSYLSSSAGASGIAGGGDYVLNNDAVVSIIKQQLQIPNVYIGSARAETANPGQASAEAQIWTDSSIFCGILKGSDSVVQKSATVKAMPVAALNFEFASMTSSQFDSADSVRRTVWVEEQHIFKAVDTNLGFVLTACI